MSDARHEVVRVARVDDHCLHGAAAARARRCDRQGGPQRGGAGGQRCDGYPCHGSPLPNWLSLLWFFIARTTTLALRCFSGVTEKTNYTKRRRRWAKRHEAVSSLSLLLVQALRDPAKSTTRGRLSASSRPLAAIEMGTGALLLALHTC